MPESILLDEIKLSIEETQLLNNIKFKISNREIHCLLGPNGAGKTLTNKVIAGIIQPSHGSIIWDDNVVFSSKTKTPNLQLLREISYIWQKATFLKGNLKTNLNFPLIIRDIPREEREKILEEYVKKFRFQDLLDKNPKKFSEGMQQRASLLRALITNPSILILDEPTASLDMASTKWFEEYIKEDFAENKRILLWTTHNQFQVKRIADRCTVIIDGVSQMTEATNEIFSNPNSPELRAYVNGELI